jgi:hypothetical protein
VDSSTSASSNVTIPVGSNSLTPHPPQLTSHISARWLFLANTCDSLNANASGNCVRRIG